MAQKKNDAAADFWSQVFTGLAADPGAAINDPTHDVAADEEGMRQGMAAAGWSAEEINKIWEAQSKRLELAPSTSPGVNANVEAQHAILCDDVEAAMDRLNMASHVNVARGVEPRVGPFASKINVISTDESVITVGAFLFRFCGLIARAFTRTLQLNPWLWEPSTYKADEAARLIRAHPDLLLYWMKIYISFAVTGTHIMAPFKPSTRTEILLMEQVARAMEIFAIAHEYGHHHLAHGRMLDVDAHQEEFAADQFALKISDEVERRPILYPNPYLSSGAGGVILLMSLEILTAFEKTLGKVAAGPNTHPTIEARISKFNSVKVLFPREFVALRGFRTASIRIMDVVRIELLQLLAESPEHLIAGLTELRRQNEADTTLRSNV